MTHDYKKEFQIIALLIKMHGVNPVTIKDVMNCYVLNKRTAERRLKAIRDYYGVDIVEEKTSLGATGWRFKKPLNGIMNLKQSKIEKEELVALNTAIKLAEKHSIKDMTAKLQSLHDKVMAQINVSAKNSKEINRMATDLEPLTIAEGIAARPGPKNKDIKPDIIATIRQAILECKEIKLTYNGKKQEHTMQPYGFLYGHRNYLVTRINNKKDEGLWALGYINNVEITDKVFVYDKIFSMTKFASKYFGVYKEEPVDVEWVFDKIAAPRAKEFIFHPKQKTKTMKNGNLKVSFKAGGLMEMAWHLYMWGDHVKVNKPKGFWNEIQRLEKAGVLP